MTNAGRTDKPGSSAAPSNENDGSRARAPQSRDGVVGSVVVEGRVTGARIGRYVVLERVGSGAMGVVYGAYDPELDRKIALKLLKSNEPLVKDETARARLLREAKAMARLAHPNVIAVHD